MKRREFLIQSLALGSSFLPALWANTNFKKLKIGYLPISDHLLIIAKDLKNSAFIPVKFASWADLSEALRSKSIDGAFILTPLALRLKTQGLDIKALLAAHRNGSALVVKKQLVKSKDIQSLKGLRIAIPSRFSTHYLLLSKLLNEAHLSVEDLKLIDMAPPEMIQALAKNAIDGFIVAEPFNLAAQNANIAEVFILSKDIINKHICCILCFHNKIIQEQNAELKILVKDFLDTAAFIHQNPESASVLAQKFLTQKAGLIARLLSEDERVIYKNLRLEKEDLTQNIEAMKKYNKLNLAVKYEDFVDLSFINLYEQSL